MLKSALLWLHDTVNLIWSSWLMSTMHREFFSTECSPSLKTWIGTKSIVYSWAFHHFPEFLLLISSPWSSLCAASTYSIAMFEILKFFISMRSLSREWGAKLHCAGWLPACSHSCLRCCGSSWTASSTLPRGYCSVFLCRQPSAALLDSGVSPLPEDWFSLVSSIHAGQGNTLPQLWCQV